MTTHRGNCYSWMDDDLFTCLQVVKREICAVITKGTLTDGEMLSANPEASYLMAVTESCQTLADQKAERTLGVCLVDAATSRITLGQVASICFNSFCSSSDGFSVQIFLSPLQAWNIFRKWMATGMAIYACIIMEGYQ